MNDDCLYFQGHLYNLKDARVREISFTARWISVKYRDILGHVCVDIYVYVHKNTIRNYIKRQLKLYFGARATTYVYAGTYHLAGGGVSRKNAFDIKRHQQEKAHNFIYIHLYN